MSTSPTIRRRPSDRATNHWTSLCRERLRRNQVGVEKCRTNGTTSAEKAGLRTKGTASAVPHRAGANEGFSP